MQAPSVHPAPPVGDPRETARRITEAVERAVRGSSGTVRLAVVALLSGGHLLVEGVPGTGKTLLAKSLATAIGGRFGRVQCTPDLLPADVTGTSVYSPVTGAWEFRPGPVFANVVLVDEVNRASPRTQAALLEPMEEHQVTVDGATHPLPAPFFLVATQNPYGSAGTFPLPESQLDRFSLVLSLARPGRDAERDILQRVGGTDALAALQPVTTPEAVLAAIVAIRDVFCAQPILDYVLDIVDATRAHPGVVLGASPRASIGLLDAARAHATIEDREYVTPDDVKAVAPAALGHRITLGGASDRAHGVRVVDEILATVAAPVPR